MKTPFFVSCQYNNFNEYIQKLSSKSRQDYKKNLELCKNYEFKELSPEIALKYKVDFEKMWQKVKKVPPFCQSILKNTHFFSCYENDKIIGLQLVEYNDNYIYCHMPMYDKIINPNVSKYMWWQLIKHVINLKIYMGIDMGGTCGKKFKHKCGGNLCNPNFKYIIQNKDKVKKYEYKFKFLTKDEKNIDTCRNYIIKGNKIIEIK